MLKISFFILLLLTSLETFADEPTVIDVRRNITLSDEDTIYKDFYINAGEGSGLKKNLVVTAVRKLSVRDASGAQAFGEVMIPVGQLRIIAIYNKIAIAREYKLLSRDELPMLEQIGIMSGDKIDLQGSFIDNSKPKYPKRKVVSETTPVTEPTTAVVVVAPATPVTPTAAPTGPAPASVAPAVPSKVEAVTSEPQKLEKSANSGNTSAL